MLPCLHCLLGTAAGSFLQFYPTCWTRCTSMKDGTQVQQCCRNSIWPWSRLANLLFHPSSSELLAVSSLDWQVWHSCVSGSLFLFYFVSCCHASYKIGTSPPCNWAKPSWWKSAACGRRALHLFPSPLCHWCVSRPNHHQLSRNIPPASTSFEASPECLLVRVSYCNSAYDNDRWLTVIFLDIAGFCSPEVNSPSSSSALWHKHFPHITVCEIQSRRRVGRGTG